MTRFTSRALRMMKDRRLSTSVSEMLTGSVVIYLVALPWLHHVLGVSWTTTLQDGLYPFVPGDIFKVYLAALEVLDRHGIIIGKNLRGPRLGEALAQAISGAERLPPI